MRYTIGFIGLIREGIFWEEAYDRNNMQGFILVTEEIIQKGYTLVEDASKHFDKKLEKTMNVN